jgi:hypothetical protein
MTTGKKKSLTAGVRCAVPYLQTSRRKDILFNILATHGFVRNFETCLTH